jgi:hypothetical protein
MIKYILIAIVFLVFVKLLSSVLIIFDITFLPEGRKYISDIIDLILYGFMAFLIFTDRIDFSRRKKA